MATKCSSNQVTLTTENMVHKRSHRNQRHTYANHRKSAVELLEASKSVYVKSTEVLNHQQQLKHPENLSIKTIDIISLSVSPAKHTALEDVSNTLTNIQHFSREESTTGRGESHKISHDQKLSHDHSSSHDPSDSEHSNHEEPVTFKKPSIPPKPATKPSVPPKPSCASKPLCATLPSSPPTVGPRPSLTSPSLDKPVPPPRTSRKLSVPESLDSSVTMSTGDRKSIPNATNATASITENISPDSSNKRYSSVSAGASILSVSQCDKESYSNAPSTNSSVQSRDARLSFHSDSFLKPFHTANLSTSVGILVETKRSPMPRPRKENQPKTVDPQIKRQLHRSHSDLSSCRHSRASSDYSDLSSRVSRTSTEVERFFNEMGIDRTVLEPMRKLGDLKQKDILDSLSSLESVGAQSVSSQLSQNDMDKLPVESEQDLLERAGSTSVVERNARIIKWLCNVKKASSAPRPSKSGTKQSDSQKKSSNKETKTERS